MSSVVVEQPLDFRSWRRKLRLPAVIAVVGLGLVTLLAIIGAHPNTGLLDPRGTGPEGAHALSVLLSDRGETVTVVSSAAELDAATDDTILVAQPDLLSKAALRAIAATQATVLLVDPGQAVLNAFGVPAREDARTDATTLSPDCSANPAVTAGPVRIDGDLYAASGAVSKCYTSQGDAGLLVTARANQAPTYILGSPSTLSNAQLDVQGDAALALGLIDNDHVDWVTQTLDAGPSATKQRGLFHLLPNRLLWGVLQLFIVLLLLALWRGRRLGAVVVEPLPVVVRASETVEGRAQLMHAARARGSAAAWLRAATIRRLGRALRVGGDDDPAAVSGLVAERTGRPISEVQSLLYGGEPADDAGLVTLAQELPRLEAAVRQTAPSSGGQQ